jgi:hypothetical protein
MSRTRPHSYVLRDTGMSVVFWLGSSVAVALVVDAFVRGDLWPILLTTTIAALAVVTNIGRVHEIPWNHVVTVRQNLSLTFELDDGRRIQASGVTAPRDRGLIMGTLTRGKLGAGSADFHKYADALRMLQDDAAKGDAPVVSRWDVRALAIGGALALAVAIVVIISAATASAGIAA